MVLLVRAEVGILGCNVGRAETRGPIALTAPTDRARQRAA